MLQFASKIAPEPALFQLVHDSGFRNTEIWLSEQLLDEVDQIIETAKQYPLGYVAHFPNRGDMTRERLEAVVKLYRELDFQTMVIHQPMLNQCAERIWEIDPDISFAVENGGMPLERFWQWAEESPGLNFDAEHLWIFTLKGGPYGPFAEIMEDFFERYHHKLRHVHMPGCLPGFPEHRPSYMSPRFSCEIWNLLTRYNYQGMAVSELLTEYQTAAHMEADVALFQEWCADPAGTLEKYRREAHAQVAA